MKEKFKAFWNVFRVLWPFVALALAAYALAALQYFAKGG